MRHRKRLFSGALRAVSTHNTPKATTERMVLLLVCRSNFAMRRRKPSIHDSAGTSPAVFVLGQAVPISLLFHNSSVSQRARLPPSYWMGRARANRDKIDAIEGCTRPAEGCSNLPAYAAHRQPDAPASAREDFIDDRNITTTRRRPSTAAAACRGVLMDGCHHASGQNMPERTSPTQRAIPCVRVRKACP